MIPVLGNSARDALASEQLRLLVVRGGCYGPERRNPNPVRDMSCISAIWRHWRTYRPHFSFFVYPRKGRQKGAGSGAA